MIHPMSNHVFMLGAAGTRMHCGKKANWPKQCDAHFCFPQLCFARLLVSFLSWLKQKCSVQETKRDKSSPSRRKQKTNQTMSLFPSQHWISDSFLITSLLQRHSLNVGLFISYESVHCTVVKLPCFSLLYCFIFSSFLSSEGFHLFLVPCAFKGPLEGWQKFFKTTDTCVKKYSSKG